MRFIALYLLKFRALSLPTFTLFGLINRRSGSFAAFITKLQNVATRIIIILQNWTDARVFSTCSRDEFTFRLLSFGDNNRSWPLLIRPIRYNGNCIWLLHFTRSHAFCTLVRVLDFICMKHPLAMVCMYVHARCRGSNCKNYIFIMAMQYTRAKCHERDKERDLKNYIFLQNKIL